MIQATYQNDKHFLHWHRGSWLPVHSFEVLDQRLDNAIQDYNQATSVKPAYDVKTGRTNNWKVQQDQCCAAERLYQAELGLDAAHVLITGERTAV